jgi:hypothetical protein
MPDRKSPVALWKTSPGRIPPELLMEEAGTMGNVVVTEKFTVD